ncbi:MAG: type II toxin-antitoxin system VapB family antitoxin [Nakamurella sp.]
MLVVATGCGRRAVTPTPNIKNPRVYELAQELAQATGTSMTGAIEVALEEMLARIRQREQTDKDRRMAELVSLLDRMRDHYGPFDGDPTAFLYDEKTGLPRGD